MYSRPQNPPVDLFIDDTDVVPSHRDVASRFDTSIIENRLFTIASRIDIVVLHSPYSRHQNPSREYYIDDTDVVPRHRDVASRFDPSIIENRSETIASPIDIVVPCTTYSRHQNPSKDLYIDKTDAVAWHRDVAFRFDPSIIENRLFTIASPVDIVVPHSPYSRHQSPSKELYIEEIDAVPCHRDSSSGFDRSVIEIRLLTVETILSAIDPVVPPIWYR